MLAGRNLPLQTAFYLSIKFQGLSWSRKIVYLIDNFQKDLDVKLNSGKPVSHCLTWFTFSLILVMFGDSSVNSLSKQLVSPSLFSLGTYGGVTFPWRGHNCNGSYGMVQKPLRMRPSLCRGSKDAPSLLWLHLPSQSVLRGPELQSFKRSDTYDS